MPARTRKMLPVEASIRNLNTALSLGVFSHTFPGALCSDGEGKPHNIVTSVLELCVWTRGANHNPGAPGHRETPWELERRGGT